MNEESAEVEEKNSSFMKIEICDFSSFEKGTETECGQFLKHQKEAQFFVHHFDVQGLVDREREMGDVLDMGLTHRT